jgi:hypothetical protein
MISMESAKQHVETSKRAIALDTRLMVLKLTTYTRFGFCCGRHGSRRTVLDSIPRQGSEGQRNAETPRHISPKDSSPPCYDPSKLDMAFTFHGLGTMAYGERDHWPDGSFITTEWFVFAYLPVSPSVSMRISYTRNSPFAKYDSAGYYIYETLPANRKQVFSTYLWFVSIIATVVLMANYQNVLTPVIGVADTHVNSSMNAVNAKCCCDPNREIAVCSVPTAP